LNRADRLANTLLFVVAALAWTAVGYVLTTVDPRDNSTVVVAGAVLLGTAVALTLAPVIWIASFVRRRIAYRGGWMRAARRAALCGLVVTLLVILRSQGALSVPMAIFVIAMPMLVEMTLSSRR
jgi:low temperature requirement protein LtrA